MIMSTQSIVNSQTTAPVMGSQLGPDKRPLTISTLPVEIVDTIATFSTVSYEEVILQFSHVCNQLNKMNVFPADGELRFKCHYSVTDSRLHKAIDSALAKNKPITSINLSSCSKLTDKGTQALIKCKDLTKLNLRGCHDLKSLEFLSELHNLQELDLGEWRRIRTIEPLGNLKHLRKLNLTTFKGIVKNGFEVLGNLTELRELVLQGQGIKSLACLNASHLRILDLTACEQLEDIDSICKMKELEKVSLICCNKIKSLEALKSLTSAEIECPDSDELGQASILEYIEMMGS
jgi:hypothetical protein